MAHLCLLPAACSQPVLRKVEEGVAGTGAEAMQGLGEQGSAVGGEAQASEEHAVAGEAADFELVQAVCQFNAE